ncbi:hypothetical protein KEM56_006090 [Ascosphaera pollenicola]|nr:hypothetical protein KEM56_006090 [Ascosphaera pollenicola]
MDLDTAAKYPLHEAAREGQNPKLANEKDADERYAIHWAVANKQIAIVDMLMEQKGLNPDVQDSSGWTPLMVAASLPNSEGDGIIEKLLSREADVNMKTNMGQNALHFATSKQNITTVKLLLENGCSARVKDKRGQLALHRAAAVGSLPIVKLLLTQGKSPLNATDNDGMTALHHAIAEGHGDCAVMLIKEGAETDKENIDGDLAINLAPDQKVRDFIVQSAKREGVDL